MSQRVHTTTLRVRYSETDQMGTFYNSRALEWFECGRTEALRALSVPYATMEDRGVLLPVIGTTTLWKCARSSNWPARRG